MRIQNIGVIGAMAGLQATMNDFSEEAVQSNSRPNFDTLIGR